MLHCKLLYPYTQCVECSGGRAVPLARMELQQQVQQLHADTEALKSRNDALSVDVDRLTATAQRVSACVTFVVFKCYFFDMIDLVF